MRKPFPCASVSCLALIVSVTWTLPNGANAAPWDPAAADYSGHRGKTIYVSKLGDNTDGSTWQKAFRTIQAALLAVPDEQGGHRVVVRPDTYAEAVLYPARTGARGAYNLLIGDSRGTLGSGATGRVILDASCPGVAVRRDPKTLHKIVQSDLPETGFKSIDWWSNFLEGTSVQGRSADGAELTMSCSTWDRWIFRDLYATGGDAGLFWDIGDPGAGFTVVVEDCVGIGRAFGGGVCYPVARPDEPSVFRRCYFLSLDWVGDAAAVLIGGSEKSMPDHPHLVMEDCTMVHADNALAISYASHCARAKLTGCRLIVLNFTQPEMNGDKNATGILCTQQGPAQPGRLHVDLEDCTLAGYSVFTPGADAKAVTYTTKGRVQAYVQYRQPLPDGFQRLGLWPAELFDRIAPPQAGPSQ
ncbi:MAG: hypothetical protein HUU20_12790 [Pirellulales bacterium]|nr:hypothetical protein [Pirellulales bacterium]